MLCFSKAIFKVLTPLTLLILIYIPAVSFSAASAGEVDHDDFAVHGKVRAYRLNVRSSPSLDSSVTGRIDRGTLFVVHERIGSIGGWIRISAGRVAGYVRNRPIYIELYQESNALKKISHRLDEHRKEFESITLKEKEVLDNLNAIDALLNDTRLHAAAISSDIQAIEVRVKEIEERREILIKEMDENKACVKSRLQALYRMKMANNNKFRRMPDSVFDFIISQRSLEKILDHDFSLLYDQFNRQKELNDLAHELEDNKNSSLKLNAGLMEQIRIIEQNREERNLILKDIRKKKSLRAAAMASLKNAAQQLRQHMKAMEAVPEVNESGGAFETLYGSLEMPVQGTIISKFGSEKNGDYTSFTFQSGIDIKVERGEPVKSVFRGNVAYANWLNGYGNLMIINHGDSYYTLYAHVEEMFKKRGDLVEIGEVIATAGDTGSINGLCLHFEIRHHDKPVDPLKWLKKGV